MALDCWLFLYYSYLLFWNNYRGDEALPVPNANTKGWLNFSWLIIITSTASVNPQDLKVEVAD